MSEEKKQADFLAKCLKQFEQDATEERDIRDEAKHDLRFVAGDQWDEGLKQDRIRKGRPVLTFNRSHTFVQQVANEARTMRGEIKFVPGEDGDKDTAEIYEGLARHIQYNSRARVAYETAVDYSAGGSFGYFRFLPDYCNDETDDQEIKVVPVMDPFAVYGVLIPACYGKAPDHAFVVEDLTKAEYEAAYPDDEISDWKAAENESAGWVSENHVRVAEYWWTERTEVGKTPRGRTRYKTTVKCCKLNGVGVLKGTETEWGGKRIPIFAVLGKVMFLEGKPKVFSVIRFQKAPQELYNAKKSREAEIVATAPISPWIADKRAIEGHEKYWANANSQTGVLPFNAEVDGVQLPAPTRNVFEPPIAALSASAAMDVDEMKAATGIFDASLGARSNESSGVAIRNRQQQSDSINMHFVDNLERVFDESGKELAEAIPVYYDAPRTIRILGADETAKVVKVNQQYLAESGEVKEHRIGGEGVGKYDVLVTVGRAYSSKRSESYEMMAQVIQSSPDILPIIGDIFFRNSDMAGAEQLAERFKKMLDPKLVDQPEGAPQIPPEVQQQMQQLGQQHDQLVQALTEAQQKLETQAVQAEAKAQIEMAKLQQQSQIEMERLSLDNRRLDFEIQKHATQLDSNEAIALLKEEMAALKANMQMDTQAAAQSAAAGAQEM